MSWGFKVWTGSAHLIIDGQSQMMRLHYKTSVTGDETISFQALEEKPLIFISPKNQVDFPGYRPKKSGSSWDQADIYHLLDDTQSEVFVFKRAEGATPSGWGLFCRSPSGELIIDGTSKMLRLHARFTGQLSQGAPVTHSFTDLGYIPPAILTEWTAYWEPIDEEWIRIKRVGYKVSSNSITLDWVELIGLEEEASPGGDDSGTYDVYVFAYQ